MLSPAEQQTIDLADALRRRDALVDDLRRENTELAARAAGYLAHLEGSQSTIATLRTRLDELEALLTAASSATELSVSSGT